MPAPYAAHAALGRKGRRAAPPPRHAALTTSACPSCQRSTGTDQHRRQSRLIPAPHDWPLPDVSTRNVVPSGSFTSPGPPCAGGTRYPCHPLLSRSPTASPASGKLRHEALFRPSRAPAAARMAAREPGSRTSRHGKPPPARRTRGRRQRRSPSRTPAATGAAGRGRTAAAAGPASPARSTGGAMTPVGPQHLACNEARAASAEQQPRPRRSRLTSPRCASETSGRELGLVNPRPEAARAGDGPAIEPFATIPEAGASTAPVAEWWNASLPSVNWKLAEAASSSSTTSSRPILQLRRRRPPSARDPA